MAEIEHDDAWALCPRVDDYSKEPMSFASLEDAERFLRSEVAYPPAADVAELEGVTVETVLLRRAAFESTRAAFELQLNSGAIKPDEFPRKYGRIYNRDQGWLNPVPIKNVVSEGSPSLSFCEFLPIEKIGIIVGRTFDDMLNRGMPEFSCYLGESWHFAELAADLEWRPGSEFDGRKHNNVAEIVWKFVYEIEGCLTRLHPSPGLSAASKADFFGSWQLWRCIDEFCSRVEKSETAERITGSWIKAKEQSDIACEFFQKEFFLYARAVNPRRSAAVVTNPASPPPDNSISDPRAERIALRDAYLASFPEKIGILDLCWAAKQRYREWIRWIGGKLKVGSKPDMAFRAILLSKKRPEDYRTERRPKAWK